MKTDLTGPLEQQILEILWTAGEPLRPADVQTRLSSHLAYTTVMTILKRLFDKKILKRTLDGKVFLYYPALSREEFIKANLSGIYGNLVGNYGDLAISQFVDACKCNKDDLELLKKYLLDSQ